MARKSCKEKFQAKIATKNQSAAAVYIERCVLEPKQSCPMLRNTESATFHTLEQPISEKSSDDKLYILFIFLCNKGNNCSNEFVSLFFKNIHEFKTCRVNVVS